MNIRILTSCTGSKKYSPDNQLTQRDFKDLHSSDLILRENELKAFKLPAEEMYTGLQHKLLMQGVTLLRKSLGSENVDLSILSAGYGIICGDDKIVPYECTFQGMRIPEIRNWANYLHIPDDARLFFKNNVDLVIVLLGETYLRALELDDEVNFPSPTIFLTGTKSKKFVSGSGKFQIIQINNEAAKRFSVGLVGLKGELFKLIAERLAEKGSDYIAELFNPNFDLLSDLESIQQKKKMTPSRKLTAIPNPSVQIQIDIPANWWNKPNKNKLLYYIPEWDDQVDPNYDFIREQHSGEKGAWNNQVYSHQIYDSPAYDGILISKIVAEKNQKKNRKIKQLGVHRYLRVPKEYPVMGDCGAFGYVKDEVPPYNTMEILNYYTQLGFNFGVSIDHLIFSKDVDERKFRYDLTIQNAEDFINEHRKLDLDWIPIGAVQGWDASSYSHAAKHYVDMGYEYIALGGLVRSKTNEILRIVKSVREVVDEKIRVHVFGIARIDAIVNLIQSGVNSIDSASYLRKSWLGSKQNYLTMDGWYSAIRVPQTTKSFRAKKIINDGIVTEKQLRNLETSCLEGLRRYDQDSRAVPHQLLSDLVEYDTLVAGERPDTKDKILKTLEEKPWKNCPCKICKDIGVEVIIFRGNNRNRRRGFHNTFIFYDLMQKLIDGEKFPWIEASDPLNTTSLQLPLFVNE